MIDNEIQIFNFEDNGIRALNIDGKPYFVGKDVADILEYQNGSRDINRHVDEEDKLQNKSLYQVKIGMSFLSTNQACTV